MRRYGLVAALGLSVAMIVGCEGSKATPSTATGPVAKAPAATVKAGKTAKAVASTQEQTDEFQQMEKLNNITGEQLQRVEAKRKEFYAGVEALGKSPIGVKQEETRAALDTAKASKDEAKIAAAEAAYKQAHGEYMAKRSALRAAVMGELTLPQQQKWAGVVLQGRVYKKGALGKAHPDEAQAAKITAICEKLAAQAVKADTVAKDPYLMGLDEVVPTALEQIKKDVLTAEQNAALAPKPAATQAAKATAKKGNGEKK